MPYTYPLLLLWFFTTFYLFFSPLSHADVVKPALVEISVNTNETVQVEIRASIEALLSGIDASYKNTKDSPNAELYDHYRVMTPEDLAEQLEPFKAKFLQQIRLLADGEPVSLTLTDVDIPLAGYTKVPRISVMQLTGQVERSRRQLTWYYPEAFGDNAVRVRQVDSDKQQWHWSDWQWLRKDATSQAFPLTELFTQTPWYQVMASYIEIGFTHIIPKGVDHILFILGLFFFSTRLKPLLWQVTMFTLAHTITLGLAMKGVIDLPANIVEPLIALSIAYVGIENIFIKHMHKGRLALVFVFGLIHGLGFAGVLQDFKMPDGDFMLALVSFNIGVELGQFVLLVVAFLALAYWFKARDWYRAAVVIPASLMISFWGWVWFFERLNG